MTKKIFYPLLLITLLAFLIRFYNIFHYPPLLWDEAALGYNAYSILNTARDEYGSFLPLVFKSFGDYKPGLYVYLCLPFVAIFGLNPVSVRLPSIILGSLLPLLIYLFINANSSQNHRLGLIAALILAFNPYNIHYSRGSWETNVLTFELLLASYLFVKNKYFSSAIIFGLSLYTYQAAKMISPILVLLLLITYRQNLKKLFLSFALPLFIIILPIFYSLIFTAAGNRLSVVNLASYTRPIADRNQIISESGSLDYQLFHNQPIFFFRNLFYRYFNHFSPQFLAFQGDWQNPRHSAPYLGVILYPSLVFLILGLFAASYRLPINIFFLSWLLLAPIPASLTIDSIQATRSMSFSLPLVYFISLGIYQFLNKYHHLFHYSLLIVLYSLSFFYYSEMYLNHLTKKSPQFWLYGYSESMNYLISKQSQFDQIYMTDFYGQPYIFYLFYSLYPPSVYQQHSNLSTTNNDVGKINHIDNIVFTTPDFSVISNTPHTLGIFSYDEILRQGIDQKPEFKNFIPLSPINNYSSFYAYSNP